MAIDKINSLGATSVSYNTNRSQNTEIRVSDAATSAANTIEPKFDNAVSQKQYGEQKNSERDDQKDGQENIKGIEPDKIKSAVSEINKQARMRHTNCEFKYHDETNRISITVKDSDTDEVIREIPPEKALDMLAKAWELAGLLVDEKR